MDQVELVLTLQMLVRMALCQFATTQDRCVYHHIGTSLVERYWIERGCDTQVWYDGCVIVVPAVALGRDVYDEADVEIWLAFQDRFRVFVNLVVQVLGGVPIGHDSGLMLAKRYALAATYALGVVYLGLAIVQMDGIVCAMLHADVTANAVVGVDFGLGSTVQLQFTAHTGTTHTQVLQCTSKACLLMAFEVVHTDYDVRICDGCTDFRSLAILSVDLDLPVVRTFQAIGDDHIAIG